MISKPLLVGQTASMDFGGTNRRVTMDNILAEPLFAPKKFFANPEQIVFSLLGQRYTRANAGVDKEEVPTGIAKPQIVQEFEMLARHCANQITEYRRGTVARQIRREPI